ncbi:MAG: hypothetical protein EOP06_05535, partial [Proteobacteria bacterium]
MEKVYGETKLSISSELKVILEAEGSHGDSLWVADSMDDNLILKFEGPIAISATAWEGCLPVVELRVTKALIDSFCSAYL